MRRHGEDREPQVIPLEVVDGIRRLERRLFFYSEMIV
jgi:hypothetical protein